MRTSRGDYLSSLLLVGSLWLVMVVFTAGGRGTYGETEPRRARLQTCKCNMSTIETAMAILQMRNIELSQSDTGMILFDTSGVVVSVSGRLEGTMAKFAPPVVRGSRVVADVIRDEHVFRCPEAAIGLGRGERTYDSGSRGETLNYRWVRQIVKSKSGMVAYERAGCVLYGERGPVNGECISSRDWDRLPFGFLDVVGQAYNRMVDPDAERVRLRHAL